MADIRVSRRDFLRAMGATLACQAAMPANADPLHMPIGFQGYDARFLLIKDWDQGWREMRDMGYQSVDLVSFKGYGYEKSPLANLSAKEIRQKLVSINMQCENCQFYFAELHQAFDEKIAFAQELKLRNIICAPEPTRMKTIDDWNWQADQLNVLGEKIRAAGFQLGYHNHDREFMAIDNVIPYDVLMARTDPKLVKFQIDVGNLTFAGADALAYLHRYPTRYFSMHAKDYLPGKTSVPVGQGILDWKKIFKAARQTPIENYFAEVAAYGSGTLRGVPANAWPTDSIDQLRQSYVYLHQLRV
ncbi:MAG: TIM barrel protein [Acidobacteriaceae bacterium]|jgi:sugar phosphate isomerase/epimerase